MTVVLPLLLSISINHGGSGGPAGHEFRHYRADRVFTGAPGDTSGFLLPYDIRGDESGRFCVTDQHRVQEFSRDGMLLWSLPIRDVPSGTFGCEEGPDGSLWVSDYLDHLLLHYADPQHQQNLIERIDTSNLPGLGAVRPVALAFGRGDELFMTGYAEDSLPGVPRVVAYNTRSRSWREVWRSATTLTGMDVDRDGSRIAVASSFGHNVTVIDTHGSVLSTSRVDESSFPWGVAWLDADSPELLVVDQANRTCVHYAGTDIDGHLREVDRFGSLGSNPCQFSVPLFVTVDRRGDVFITDRKLNRVTRWIPDYVGCP